MEISLRVMYGELSLHGTARMCILFRFFSVHKQSLATIECFRGEQMPRLDFGHVQDDVNLHILRIFEGTFCLMRPILGLTSEYLKHSARQAVLLVYRNNRIWKQ